ncbi:MAG: hypothetical protein M5U31_16180 [Acidimicrobiia bacterium]|nr:hypothetical protein [Acidimicrobiia bacterium]
MNTTVLTVGGAKRAVAVFLDDQETFEDSGERFDGATPVAHALAVADQQALPWVVLTRGRQIRVYSSRPDVGVGRKGRADTYVELNLALLPEDSAGYLTLLFGTGALRDGGSFEQLLETSADFAADLGERLRDRVYFDAVPDLATAVALRLGDPLELDDEALDHAYEQTLVILFRLLFVAYAEDKDLLPYRTNSLYADHSLKHVARRLTELHGSEGGSLSTHRPPACGTTFGPCGRRSTRATRRGASPPTTGACSATTPTITTWDPQSPDST